MFPWNYFCESNKNTLKNAQKNVEMYCNPLFFLVQLKKKLNKLIFVKLELEKTFL